MGVLGIYLFVFCSYENIEVTCCFPLLFMKLYFGYLFFENGIADNVSEESLTNVFVFFGFVHEISEENGEMNYI